ncbi:hypothetical protein E4U41_000899 [Claviceps citrina]|nr:hypothetical protein E4U41_000899 [Claviceps citrina]
MTNRSGTQRDDEYLFESKATADEATKIADGRSSVGASDGARTSGRMQVYEPSGLTAARN